MAKTARLDLRLDPDLKRRVDERAAELGQKTTTFVERALEKALASGADASAAARPGELNAGTSAPPRASKGKPSIRDTWAR